MIKSRKKISGGHAAVQSLKKEKVEHVFGLIGSATMEMFDALYHEKKIKFIGVRDEPIRPKTCSTFSFFNDLTAASPPVIFLWGLITKLF